MSIKTHAVKALAAMACIGLAATACSSDDNSFGGDGVTSEAQIQEAKEALEGFLQKPTDIGITEPLPAAPEKGLLVSIASAESNSVNIAQGLKEAATIAGWDYKEIPFDVADPATLVKGLEEALELKPKPTGVTFTGVDRSLWGQVVDKYKAAGVKLVPIQIGETELDDTVVGSIAPLENLSHGEMLADWVAADSEGKGHVLVSNVPSFPVLKNFSDGFNKEIDRICPGCKVTALDSAVSDVAAGNIPGQVVSMIQQDPTISYVVSSVGDFAGGIDTAIKAAGLADKVKLAGEAAGAPQRAGIINGTEDTWSTLCFQYNGFQVMDVLLRSEAGIDFDPTGGPMPRQLLNKDNIGTDPQKPWCEPTDYAERFKALWQVK